MNIEVEQALKVKSIALDIIEELLKDEAHFKEKDLKQTAEMLSRCVCDLVNVYTGISESHESALKGTIAKARISYNAIAAYKQKV
ncbi:hypothetical protein FZC84_18115 [Rossellomorea vietnamensis]|uniref:Uncharacterized protein n=1 Tax=Rossellomorea vietnamensis TaxID=218284 RepID=A0A5D4M7Z4_9BACI|nr:MULTISPECIES: hypothetical protein [Bacillaceae]TYR97597.1 hypothetical protein FZC84_18115 [Rossellomorea vietnamensis]